MIDYAQLLLLGAIAGFTIFLGLPLAILQNVSPRKKGFLNALSIGILLFLVIDVFSHAWNTATAVASTAFSGRGSTSDAAMDLLAVFGGLALGLLGLVAYEAKYMAKAPPIVKSQLGDGPGAIRLSVTEARQIQLLQEHHPYRLAMMIAIGIGAHNFSEGLAVGQSYAAGSVGLALLLIVGFGAHNTTEGFGIAGPLAGLIKRPTARFLAVAGLVGGGPTFVGTVVGSLWTSVFTYVLFLSLAGGAIVYVSMLMYNSGRKQTTNQILMIGIFVGLCAGFLTDLIVTLGGA
ncbi:MAG TPA: ZIP family metal transporter [Candidatus Bathyarchaeia archaeon]|nr:ZIP family metal transporter [Candidatus Bathyarchaeia archaeon]